MADLEVKKRFAARAKDVRKWRDAFVEQWGVPILPEEGKVEVIAAPPFEGLVCDRKWVVVTKGPQGDRTFPTVRGLLMEKPHLRWVTVDMGAVPFVHNGADIMAPGIVDADPLIEEGDLVWVRDERHGQPLAVGITKASGRELIQGTKGKVIQSLHHIGDELWNLEL